MIKQEIISELSERTRLSRSQAEEAFEATLAIFTEAFKKGDNIELRGFGQFKVITRKAKCGQDIRNGKTIHIPARNIVKFKLSKNIQKEFKQ